jgi:AI-2 transport protein TqsA
MQDDNAASSSPERREPVTASVPAPRGETSRGTAAPGDAAPGTVAPGTVPPGPVGVAAAAAATAASVSTPFRILVGAAALVVIVGGMRAAQPVLVPLALAAFLTVISMPLLTALRRLRVPNMLAIPLVLLLVVGVLFAIGAIATNSLLEIRDALPRYVARFGELYGDALEWLTAHRVLDPQAVDEILVSPTWLVNVATGLFRGFAGFMSMTVLVALVTFFLLAETAGVPRKLRAAPGQANADLQHYGRLIAEIQRYLAIKTLTSLSTGILIGIWALIIGLDFPLFWGLSAFLLNYVPTIGSLVAAVPAVLLALLQLGFGGAMLTAGGYLFVNTVIGNLIEPTVMGRGLGLSPFVVLASLLFWGWVWGPIGMLLSLPLTMVIKIMLENSRSLAWVAVLMGPARDARTTTFTEAARRRRASDPANS